MATTKPSLIPLESGDRLTRGEFHRRYCARSDIHKAELVQGVVYVPSPARFGEHGKPQRQFVMWLGTYAERHPGVEFGFDVTIYLDADNEVQPDGILFRASSDAAIRETDDGYLRGTPDLVVEIAASSASYDLHDKKEAYRRAAVPEYIVWSIYEKRIDWFRLVNSEYVRVEADEHGIIESSVFPGLRLHVAKMLAGDLAGVLAALDPPPAASEG